MKTIFHVDLNSYFATVEQQQNPHLRGKPVGIVKDLGRTCIIAASIEAKSLGIKTGSNVLEARKAVPKLVLVKADFDKYLDYTQRFYRLIRSFSPEVNLFVCDEAFLDATYCLKIYGSVQNLARQIQAKIFVEMGSWVTASIGIAKNRTLAKLAGEFAPKGGFFAIDDTNLDIVLSLSKMTDICGIGPRLSRRLKRLGITNRVELRDLDSQFLKKRFGPFWGPELKRIGWAASFALPSRGK